MTADKGAVEICCKRCGQPFRKTGTRNWFCRPCAPYGERERAAERRREWRAEKPEAAKQYQRGWISKNRSRVRAAAKSRRHALGATPIGSVQVCHCGKSYEFYHGSLVECRDCAVSRKAAEATARAATWNKANRDRRNRRFRERYQTEPARRLNIAMTVGVGACLKDREGKGGRKWLSLVPYSLEELFRHIERQFTDGMSWKNMGEWHVDHIVPLASFRFYSASDAEFKAAWALTNLRPLWATDNFKKGGRRLHLI